MQRICIVGIAKDELPFIDEWIIYHKMIGVDHFFLYDDEADSPLTSHLKHYSYVTVVPWHAIRGEDQDTRNQVRAYTHAKETYLNDFEWVSFLDIDEFLVFRNVDNIHVFLAKFEDAACISLNWHVFGHNGYYDDPPGLITSSLTRRMNLPGRHVKSISRTHLISSITPHYCRLTNGKRVDANNRKYSDDFYEGKTSVAHVNHYQCRSFRRWMKRSERGDVNFNFVNAPDNQKWRLTEESCLKQFVTTVALNKNELIDEYMIKFSTVIHEHLSKDY